MRHVGTSPAVADSTVYVGSNDGHLDAIVAVSGDELFGVETDDEVPSSAAVTVGTAFVGSSDSRVYAVDHPTGGESVSATAPGTTEPTSTATAPTGGSGGERPPTTGRGSARSAC